MKRWGWGGLCVALAFGCSSEPEVLYSTVMQGPSAQASTPAPPPSALPETLVQRAPISESEFVETERSRDPFRSYAARFLEAAQRPAQNERKVTLAEYAVDELKPIAIVRAPDYPRAMLVDPNGKGWVVKKGDYIGQPEVVHLGGAGGTDYQVNWRVDRIREGDIVLVRDDPAQPGAAPVTKVIALRSDEPALTP